MAVILHVPAGARRKQVRAARCRCPDLPDARFTGFGTIAQGACGRRWVRGLTTSAYWEGLDACWWPLGPWHPRWWLLRHADQRAAAAAAVPRLQVSDKTAAELLADDDDD